MTNIIKLNNAINNSITEIRIEEVRDVDFNYKPYWYIYCVLKNGKSIDLSGSLDNQNLAYTDFVHLTKIGSKVLGKEIAKYIKEANEQIK